MLLVPCLDKWLQLSAEQEHAWFSHDVAQLLTHLL
jgi:hypothetical protein